ncbi:MAG: cytochrome c peroxidase [Gammaproteobacteria bacterium]
MTTAVVAPLGLPPVPVPADNPQAAAGIERGDKLYQDTRPGAAGKVSCATCHDASRGLPTT